MTGHRCPACEKPAPDTHLVLPAHACGQPLAPPITLTHRQETADAPCPY